MGERDEVIVGAADKFEIDGYIFGDPTPASVSKTIAAAMAQQDGRGAAMPYQVARLREQGIDFILVPFNSSFAGKTEIQQRRAIEILKAAAAHAGLVGEVVPVWDIGNRRAGFFAPLEYHQLFETITLDFVYANLNRDLYIEWPDDAAEDAPIARAAPNPTAAAEPGNRRTFAKEDVDRVLAAFQEMGPEKFVSSFVRRQPIMMNGAHRPTTPIMSEYFVSVDSLRKPLFADADMRGAGQVFNHLTLALDQIILHSLNPMVQLDQPFSINLNLQTVFSAAFNAFIDRIPPDRLMVEFRQADVSGQMDKFEAARARLAAKGVKIAIDQIFPDTLGVVNLDSLGIDMAKICWSRGAAVFLREHTVPIRKLRDCGVDLVISRVDDLEALDIGAELGIERFQGFLIDEIVRKTAAQTT
jgi:hypothetical protein